MFSPLTPANIVLALSLILGFIAAVKTYWVWSKLNRVERVAEVVSAVIPFLIALFAWADSEGVNEVVGNLRNEVTHLNGSVTAEGQRADHYAKQLQATQAELDAANLIISNSRNRLDSANAQIEGLQLSIEKLSATSARTRSGLVQTQRQFVALTQVLAQTRNEARQASVKAGVFHLPEKAAAELENALRASAPGTAVVGCNAGLEALCDDLTAVFRRTAWKTDEYKGAALFSGPLGHGMMVLYRSDHARVAQALADALQASQLDVATLLDSNGPNAVADIQLTVRYVK